MNEVELVRNYYSLTIADYLLIAEDISIESNKVIITNLHWNIGYIKKAKVHCPILFCPVAYIKFVPLGFKNVEIIWR